MNLPNEKAYLLIELVTTDLNPYQIELKQKAILRKLDTCRIKYHSVCTAPEDGAMGGDIYPKKWVAGLIEADRKDVESKIQEENVKVTNISEEEKNNLLNNNQPTPEKK